MTKTKKFLIIIGSIDLLLIIMHLIGYYFLFLKPTGYLIPIALNIVTLAIIGFRHPRINGLLVVAGVLLGTAIMLVHAFFILIGESSYKKITSPNNQQALVVEYQHFTLGETTYSYNFYKTKFGIIGRELRDQSIRILVRHAGKPGRSQAEDILGMNNSEWVGEDIVRFSTNDGIKELYLNPSRLDEKSSTSPEPDSIDRNTSDFELIDSNTIEQFIEKAEQKTDGDEISINGNIFVTRYDTLSGQYWIEVQNPNDQAPIPRQQCSRIVRNEERQYYMLEECTHKWKYELYPITSE
ncbi:hypothetical protein SAMN05421663_10875 [Terribacillus halophilus]|uniref:Uncharacterized protein n=1 Tax=Terribacillus halophilus TaxID=361279 RepID=A0A1G6T9B0_9BACI|nr:hypothetical protein [Terribacillus halophilus]SDD24925.1 hypothetical protein SAMN05421663_10875 [Terribacillus halophilus]